MWRLTKWTAIVLMLAFLVYVTVAAPSAFTDNATIFLAVAILGVPFGIALVVILALMVVDTMRYLNPFYTIMGDGETDPRKGPPPIIIREEKKDRKKFCPICKRKTRCRVTWAKGMKMYVHVMRG